MKYMAIFDDAMLSYFRRDDADKLTLVMHDEAGAARAVRLKPIIRPTVTIETGESVYITQGHIDAMVEFEQGEGIKEATARLNQIDWQQLIEEQEARNEEDHS